MLKISTKLFFGFTILTAALSFGLLLHPIATKANTTKKVVGFIAYWDQDRGFQSVKNNAGTITEISPVWYGIDASGNILPFLKTDGTSYVDTNILSYARTNNILVVPTIQNYVNGHWDGAAISVIINNQSLTAAHINKIVDLVSVNGYDGIDIDYENLSGTDRAAFSNFVSLLGQALHAKGKLLSIDVYGKTNEPGDWGGQIAQDWTTLGATADEMRVMAYGYSWDTSPAGPIAPISWVRNVVAFANTTIPQNKIIVGIPTYGVDWPASGAGIEYMWDQIVGIAAQKGSSVVWDTTSMAPWFNYAGTDLHTVWFENSSSTNAKLNVFDELGVGGISIWRLGGEDPGVWQSIRAHAIVQPKPAVDIKANGLDGPLSLVQGTSAMISWTTLNATTCAVSPDGWSGTANVGTSTGALFATTTYVLSCTGLGGTSTDAVTVGITGVNPQDTTPPVVSITSPQASTTLSRLQKIAATASDNMSVAKVLFYGDTTLLATDTTAPYTATWDTRKLSRGTHEMSVVALDSSGNSASTSISVMK